MGEVALTAIPDLIQFSKSVVDSDAEAGFAALGAMGRRRIRWLRLIRDRCCEAISSRNGSKWADVGAGRNSRSGNGDKEHLIDALLQVLLDPDPPSAAARTAR